MILLKCCIKLTSRGVLVGYCVCTGGYRPPGREGAAAVTAGVPAVAVADMGVVVAVPGAAAG